ncbi:MAG: DNA-processing protein DprA [Anaerolineae bacterium]|nr:DNA-processing protein DprA [Anaerolineae bacterium]
MADPMPPLVGQVALSLIPGLGGKTFDRLAAHFGPVDAILAASERELIAVPRVGPKLAAAIRAIDLEQTQRDISTWQANGIAIMVRHAAAAQVPQAGWFPYPPALESLDDAPPVLLHRGAITRFDPRAAAIVGTRHPTTESRQLAETLAAALAARGWIIVSGLASGIDTAAHQGAIRAGGTTIAVLGSGLSTIYPLQNRALAERIITCGALVSEVHPHTPPNSPALVARNRLISGLSRAVIVIEAGATSGSLHAAHFARTQKRLVVTIDTHAPGNQQLLAEGATVLPADAAAQPGVLDTLEQHMM